MPRGGLSGSLRARAWISSERRIRFSGRPSSISPLSAYVILHCAILGQVFRPLGPHESRQRTRRRILVAAVGLVAAAVAVLAWTAWQARQLPGVVAQLRTDGARLQDQLRASDLTGAAATSALVRQEADHARSLTSGPVWATAQFIPGVGRNVAALRDVTTSLAEILDAAQPLEAALPQLDPKAQKAAGGQVNVQALTQVAGGLPGFAQAIDAGYARMQLISPAGLQPQVGDGVRTLQSVLSGAKGPADAAASALSVVPTMLGATGPQNYVVLLQQDAEARGTGGLVGSYAVVRADEGRLSLVDAQGRAALGAAPIPTAGLPDGLQALWGKDLTEWAGLNLSPHFPWTGQLVAAGWASQHRTPKLDFVVGLDEYVIAALLKGTGPVTVDGITFTSDNAARVLSRDVYARFAQDPAQIDLLTAGLVQQVFSRIAAGQFSLPAIVQAMVDPVQQRRLTIWSADTAIEGKLEALAIGGALPDTPGPFAMTVVNNGGGNKLDAYLKVGTTYDPGECDQDVRLGHITVTLNSSAPARGLPDYVTIRNDLIRQHKPNKVVGSNRVIVDVYGPVGASSPLANLDGNGVSVTTGLDRNHPVWQVIVPIAPGQTRTLDVLVLDPVPSGVATAAPPPKVLTQPMAIPATASAVTPLRPCAAG